MKNLPTNFVVWEALTKNQASTRLDHLWPEILSWMSTAAQRKESSNGRSRNRSSTMLLLIRKIRSSKQPFKNGRKIGIAYGSSHALQAEELPVQVWLSATPSLSQVMSPRLVSTLAVSTLRSTFHKKEQFNVTTTVAASENSTVFRSKRQPAVAHNSFFQQVKWILRFAPTRG